jgi:hypothetical protein
LSQDTIFKNKNRDTIVVSLFLKLQKQNMNAIVAEKNGVTLTSAVEVVKRGEIKGQAYPVFIPTPENFEDYVKFVGKDKVITMLAARARTDAQAVLDYVFSDESLWGTRELEDPETKQKSKISYLLDSAITDERMEKVKDALLSGEVVGGVSIKDLREELVSLSSELKDIVLKAALDSSLYPQAMKLAERLQDLEKQIEAKKKTRTPKEVPVAA